MIHCTILYSLIDRIEMNYCPLSSVRGISDSLLENLWCFIDEVRGFSRESSELDAGLAISKAASISLIRFLITAYAIEHVCYVLYSWTKLGISAVVEQ